MLTLSPYPADPRPRRAAEALLQEGMTVDLICVGDENQPRRETLSGLDILRLPIAHRRGGKLSYAFEYSAFILMAAAILAWRSLKRRFDLVYVHNMPDVLVASALLPKLLGAKVVLDMHDPMPELMATIFGLAEHSLQVRLMRWQEKWSMARADLVIAVNVACQRIFAARSCPPAKIGVVMNSPDEKIFPCRRPGSCEVSTNGAGGRFTIMYHGSLVQRNGLDLAVAALARVREAVPGARLKVYGRKTAFLQSVMEDVRARGMQDCVEYLGPRPLEGLVAEIEQCDVGVIPNHKNSFTEINTPTRIFEYLALGKPVVAPRTPGIQDYFDAESLLFFEPGNPDDLAAKLKHVALNSSAAMNTAERGQEVYRAHRWSSERRTLVNLIDGLFERSMVS